MEQMIDGLLQQRRRKELERIPYQRAVEAALRKVQALAQKIIGAARVSLVRHEIAIAAEGFIQRPQDIVRVDAMSERGNEGDVGLASACEIEDRQIIAILDGAEELIQAVAGSRLGLECRSSAQIRRIQRGRTSLGP